MYGYIYKITNKINNKIYIGKTKNSIHSRWVNHVWISNTKKQLTTKLHRAIHKYGVQNFIIEEIEKCLLEDLDKREIYWIKYLKSTDNSIGYNICRGGEGGTGGDHFKEHHHSLETREKMSLNRKGKFNSNYNNHWNQSDELKRLHSKLSSGKNNGMYGKHQSSETKEKIRNSKLNKCWVINKLGSKLIDKQFLDFYINQGYIKGRVLK